MAVKIKLFLLIISLVASADTQGYVRIRHRLFTRSSSTHVCHDIDPFSVDMKVRLKAHFLINELNMEFNIRTYKDLIVISTARTEESKTDL